MARKLAIALLLGAALISVAALWWAFVSAIPRPVSPGAVAAIPVETSGPAPVASSATAPSNERAEIAELIDPAPLHEAASKQGLAYLRGRCVRAEDQAPLEGCTVELSGHPLNSSIAVMSRSPDWKQPEQLVTGPDGRFELEFTPPKSFMFSLEIHCSGRSPRTGLWRDFEPGHVEELGDVALALGFPVEGRVVDAAGVPVAGVGVSIGGLPIQIDADRRGRNNFSARSDESGSFRFDIAFPPGTWSLNASSRAGHKLVSPDRVDVDSRLGAAPLTVVVRAMPAIRGRVVDELGNGVERVSLRARLLKQSGRMASARTAEDGTFTIYAVDDDLAAVRLEVQDPGPCEPPEEPTEELEWGSEGVQIQLVRALSFELEVVERGSGAPVEAFAVICRSDDVRSSRYQEPRLGGPHPEGRVTVDKVWRGTVHLEVLPLEPDFAPSEPFEFEVVAAPLAPLRVELERMRLCSLRVRTASGDPVVGSRVELVRLGSAALDAEGFVLDRARGGSISSTQEGFQPHVLLGTATTDATGSAELFATADAEQLGLRVLGPTHLPLVVQPVRFAAEGPLELVVEGGGSLAGHLRLDGWPRAKLGLLLDPAGKQVLSWRFDPTARIESDGAFRTASLAPGTYSVRLQFEGFLEGASSRSYQPTVLEPPLATVTLAAGRTTEVELDASHFAPGSVVGHVLLDGAPPEQARVTLQRETRDGTSWSFQGFGQFFLDAAGRFEAINLPPGSYRAVLVLGDFKTSEGDSLHSEETFEIGATERVERSFEFMRKRLVVRILKPDGVTPLARTELQFHTSMYLSRTLRTNDEGRVVLDPAPTGELYFQVLGPPGLGSGPITPPAGAREAELDVVLRPQ